MKRVFNIFSLAVILSLMVNLVGMPVTTARAAPLTITTYIGGGYQIDGTHVPNNYFVGWSGIVNARSYFVFDLSSVSGSISSATLRIYNPASGYSGGSSETLGFYDVTMPIALLTSGAGGGAAHTDLGSGTTFGSVTVTSASNNTWIEIPLNASGVTAINGALGGSFAIGGVLETDAGFDYVFRNSNLFSQPAELVIDTAAPTHTVTFHGNGNDGGSMSSQIASASTALDSNTFTRSGYAFAGWDTDPAGTTVVYADGASYNFLADLDLYAVWNAISHTVIFDANGGLGVMSPQTHLGSDWLNWNNFYYPGYLFTGWNTAADGSGVAYADGATYDFSADITLHAQWTNLFTFSDPFWKMFPLDTATGVNEFGSTLIWTPSYSASDFEYCYDSNINNACDGTWQSTANQYHGFTDSLIAGTTYEWQVRALGAIGMYTYADFGAWWTFTTYAPTHTVTFHGNGNDGGLMSPQVASASTALTSNAFTRSGYAFAGWDTDPAGTTVVYADGASYDFLADLDLYAVWTATCLSAVTVSNANDSGAGSLRQALEDVCDGGTINFANPDMSGATITLASELMLNKSVTIDGSGVSAMVTVSGNNASRVFNISSGAVTLKNLTVANGNSGFGAGAFVQGGATLNVTNSVFSGNIAPFGSDGGGIYSFGTLNITNSTFSGNSAGNMGAGIMNNATATISNSVFSGNTGWGGGIVNNGTLTVLNSTFFGNTGGITNFGTLNIKNSILANSAPSSDCYNPGGTLAVNINNLIQDGTCSPMLSGNPLLSALGNYGSETPTFALLPGSPAIDAGDSATCVADPVNKLDQRGVPRPAACDIGAFESRGFTLAYDSGSGQSATVNTDFANPLIVTVSPINSAEPVNGGAVTFTAPSGPGATFTTNPVTIVSGTASAAAKADGTAGGPYTVTASANGAADGVDFSLTNTAANHTVTFHGNSNDGGSMSPQVANASTALDTNAFTRSGYTFAGWDTDPAGATVVYTDGASYAFSADLDLYAVWTAIPAPEAFTKTGLADGSILKGTSVDLTWTASAGAVTYEYCLDETPGNTCTTAWAGMGNVLTLNRGGLPANSTFYWQIRAVNGSLTKTEADGGTWWSFTLDNTAPQLSLPADINLEADTLGGRNVTFSATATDIVDGSVKVSCDATSGDLFPVGVTTVNCSATDTANNTANGSFTVTITDATDPQLNLPADINLEANALGGRNVIFSATATDIVDGSVAVSCDATSGDLFPVGVTTVNCSATDTANNTANGSFTVTITDATDPQLNLPADINLEADTLGGRNVIFSVTATDIVDGSVAVSCDATSSDLFPVGVTTVNCSATDAHTNTANGSFTVTITDTTDPQLSLPSNIITNATSAAGAVVTFSVSATDIVDGSVAVSCTPASGSTFPVGLTTVDCSAKDTAGNTGMASFTVTVLDATAPTVLSSVLVNPSPTNLSSVDFTVTFSENVTGVDLAGPTFDDFNLTTSAGISGAFVSAVSGSNDTYTVTVNTGSGNGTIRLNVGTGGSIVDAASNPLTASFVTGQTYSVVKAPSFTDIDPAYWAYTYIERLYMAGITNGCTTVPQAYCPNSPTTRAQLAVMILRGKYGAAYVPPAVGGSTGFNDVPTSYWAAAWIKQLAAEGISSGCGGGNFCPDAAVTRAQVAVMLVRATHGAGFVPQTATGVFNDVAVGSFGADYIEQLWADGVTSGCGGGNFCPSVIVKRDQIAVFLVKAFHLP